MKRLFLNGHKNLHLFILLIPLLFQTASILRAQGSLFTELNPLTLNLNPTQQSIVNYLTALPYNAGLKYVQVGNLSTIQQNGTLSFTIPGFESSPLTFTHVDVNYHSASDYSWVGQSASSTGELAFYARPEGYGGSIDLGTKFYSINPLGGNLAVIMKHNLNAYPPADCASTSSGSEGTDFCQLEDCGASVVDVLVLITPAAAANMTATWGSLANFYLWLGTNTMPTAFVQSGIPNKQVRVQYLPFTPGFPLTNNMYVDMDHISSDPVAKGFFDTYRVDVIVLLTNQQYVDPGTGVPAFGVANSLNPASTNKFCIVEAPFLLDPRYTFAHEVGHQFGCHHIETNDDTGNVCAHAHVLELPGNVKRATIMGPSKAAVMGDPQARIQHYSNPGIFFAGLPTGIAGLRDNAREIRASMCDVANNEPPPTLIISIEGLADLCSPHQGGGIANGTYAVNLTPPVAGFPGQPPYAVKWYWKADGIFNPGVYLGSGMSVSVDVFSCPSFYLRAVVTTGDGQTYTQTRKINTAFCSACSGLRPTGTQGVENSSDADAVKIYPNPTDGLLWVEFTEGMLPQNMELFDLSGKKVQQFKASASVDHPHQITLDLSGVPPGVYSLHVENDGHTIMRKVVVQSH